MREIVSPLDGLRGFTSRSGVSLAAAFDTDAQAYITAVEAADTEALEPGVRTAINDFVVGCKADGIWDALKASCILAGARTLDGALVPLRGAAPTNFNFVPGDYNRATGLVGDGSTKYLDSNRNNNVDPQNDQSMGVYRSSTPTGGAARVSIGTGLPGVTGTTRIAVASGVPGQAVYRNRSAIVDLVNSGMAVGLNGMSRSLSTEYVARGAGVNHTFAKISQLSASGNVAVFAVLPGGSFSDERMAFYWIGEALDLALLDARVTTLINAYAAI